MPRVLVTGATGCVGSQVLPLLLARGWEVHGAAVDCERGGQSAGVTWHQADLLRPDAPSRLVQEVRPELLLHLAWSIAPGQWADSLQNFAWVTASMELARAFHEHGGRRFVGAGSCLEYDWNYGYCSEELTPCVPHTVYGTCKHSLQVLLDAYFKQAGIAFCWGRIFFLYGPFEHPRRLVPSVARSLLRGQRAKCSHGLQIRDYLFSADVADAFVSLLDSAYVGVVNIASGQAISLRQLVSEVARTIGRPGLVDFGALPEASTDKPLVVADVARLSQQLGWRPKWSLEQGVAATAEWWRAELSAEGSEAE